ncbi:hypothetical protein ABTN46_19710, partial [Acinetobacter baumannii]
LVIALMVPLIASLWWAKPGGAGLSIFAIAAILWLVNVLFAYGEMMHNAMIMSATGTEERPHASGLALALGNFVSTFMLAF